MENNLEKSLDLLAVLNCLVIIVTGHHRYIQVKELRKKTHLVKTILI